MTELSEIAKKVRESVILMSYEAKSAHLGGSLSCIEILVTLYFHTMKVFPKDPDNPKRDRLIFSKAHDSKALYSVLAERGFFPKDLLKNYEKDNAVLPGHPTRHVAPGVEVSAGSLGHGLPLSCGIAYSGKLDRAKFRAFAILSDGECQEGSTWEAALFAGHHRLDNLVAIVDYNKLQGFGRIKDVLDLEPFKEKFKDFGWECVEVDGHNIDSLVRSLRKTPLKKGKPSVIIAHTIKGYGGVPRYKNKVISHYRPPTQEEATAAIKKLNIK